jgi:DNA sulfur modification protein DndD
MRLSSMRLHNFRQFKGSSPEIIFSSPGGRPVTVFFGTNGSGKTALLNAFTWTLYGTTSRGFLLPEQVVNKAALREAKPNDKVETSIEIKFEHLGYIYAIRKTQAVRRGPTEAEVMPLGMPVTELQWAGPDGRWKSESSVSDAVGRILPEDLHTYFFFDGERIERLVQPKQEERADIANATKKLFSLEILDRAIRHVGSARKTLENEYQKIGDAKTVTLLAEKKRLEEAVAAAYARVKELDENILTARGYENEIQARLEKLEEVKEIQERRKSLEDDRDKRAASLRQVRAQVSLLINSRAYTVFLGEACETYRSIVETMRHRGELPAGIKRQFVEDLLSRDMCICGRSLGHDDSSDARAVVKGWINRAGLADVEEKAIRMGGEVKQLEIHTRDFWSQLDGFEERRYADRVELSRIESELTSISQDLLQSNVEEVGELERQLQKWKRQIEEYLREQGAENHKISSADLERVNIESDLSKHQNAEARQQLAQRRLNASKEVIDRIAESKKRFEVKFRVDLTKKVRMLFDTISYTPYIPEITEDFGLQLRESAGGMPLPVAASQGESQILSLCFIGGVIALAREYQARTERLPGPDSSQFPLVMDSPFGSLGPTYRRQVADHITTLADQVILMVTNTQWRGEVEQSLRGRVGRAYLLQYYSPKPDVARETIEIGSASYDLINVSPSEYEYTAILEVANA